MNEDDRALVIELGEDPDDPALIDAYKLLDQAFVSLSDKYHRIKGGFTDPCR